MPPFHGDRMRAYADAIIAVTDAEIDALAPGSTFRIKEMAQRITLDVILRVVFGDGMGARHEALRDALREATHHAGKPYLLLGALQRDWGGWSPWSRFTAARSRAQALMFARFREVREQPAPAANADVLTMLAHAEDEHGERLGEQELADEIATLLVAGHETTGGAA